MRRLTILALGALLFAACGEETPPDDPCSRCGAGESCSEDRCVAVPTCTDGARNGAETDLDCGGGCAKCALGKACALGADCATGSCVSGLCVAVVDACSNGVKDGNETDLDCGRECVRCALGKACASGVDCASGACTAQVCVVAEACDNGVKDGDETDLDCGGDCPKCANGLACGINADCTSGNCGAAKLCQVAAGCDNGVKDGLETDLDCGGSCAKCANDMACGVDADCASGWCDAGLCKVPACDDEALNGDEMGVDCGGSCDAGCAEGTACEEHSDCLSGLCAADHCAPPRIEVLLNATNDAIFSYLMAPYPDWNQMAGSFVSLGLRPDPRVSYHTALRFNGVQIPAGATITEAWLSFHPTNEVDSSTRLALNVFAEKQGNSAPFDPSNYESGRPDQRSHTAAFIDRWVVRCRSDCTDLNEYDCPQRKLDCWNRTVRYTVPKNLKALVQEVVALPAWAQGNALTMVLANGASDQDTEYNGSRSIVGFDPELGAEFSPKLVVEWAMPAAR